MYYSAVPIMYKQANWGDKRFYLKLAIFLTETLGKLEGFIFCCLFVSSLPLFTEQKFMEQIV